LYKGPNNKGPVVSITCSKPPWSISLAALTRSKTSSYPFKKAGNIKGSFLVLLTKSAENKTLKLSLVHSQLDQFYRQQQSVFSTNNIVKILFGSLSQASLKLSASNISKKSSHVSA
jgi:hypothetical protein